jgi:hypothetical protein
VRIGGWERTAAKKDAARQLAVNLGHEDPSKSSTAKPSLIRWSDVSLGPIPWRTGTASPTVALLLQVNDSPSTQPAEQRRHRCRDSSANDGAEGGHRDRGQWYYEIPMIPDPLQGSQPISEWQKLGLDTGREAQLVHPLDRRTCQP